MDQSGFPHLHSVAPLRCWVVVELRCALVSGLRSVCGSDIWVAGFGFGGSVICGCEFVLWCCVGALVVVVPHFFLFCL